MYCFKITYIWTALVNSEKMLLYVEFEMWRQKKSLLSFMKKKYPPLKMKKEKTWSYPPTPTYQMVWPLLWIRTPLSYNFNCTPSLGYWFLYPGFWSNLFIKCIDILISRFADEGLAGCLATVLVEEMAKVRHWTEHYA